MAEVKVVATPQGTISFNYEELKAELVIKASEYNGLVYTPETIPEAKADRAKLNKLKTALNDERIRREKEWMIPFADFKEKVNELIGIIEKPIAQIDAQIKEVETVEKERKRALCKEAFMEIPHPEWLAFDKIENPKWTNKTVSISTVKDEISYKVGKIVSDMELLEKCSKLPTEAKGHYMMYLDFNGAMEFSEALARDKAKPDADEEPSWVSFRVLVTPTQAQELKRYLKINNIQIKKGE